MSEVEELGRIIEALTVILLRGVRSGKRDATKHHTRIFIRKGN
jgi:hypothetical protein